MPELWVYLVTIQWGSEEAVCVFILTKNKKKKIKDIITSAVTVSSLSVFLCLTTHSLLI